MRNKQKRMLIVSMVLSVMVEGWTGVPVSAQQQS